MPVFAEQKEPTTFVDRVVEPGLDAEIAHGLLAKEEQAPSTQPLTQQTPSPLRDDDASDASSSSTTPRSESADMTTEKIEVVSSAVPNTDQHVIIFDWDDTLLASSFLASQGYRLDVDMETRENFEFVKNELLLLEKCIINLLNEALQRGVVNIVTNAETGWVELSAQKFLPGVVPYLSKVTVISARSTYEHLYPDSPVKWKYCAMYDRLASIMHDDCRKNIMSFGDSHVEREAVRTVTRGLTNTRTKSIKFSECPNTEQLRKQLELVASCFQYIFTHEGDLDLMLKMSMVPANSAPVNPPAPVFPAPSNTVTA